jgi:DNA polymerase
VKTFVVSDLAAIEVRVGAWVSQCQPLLDVFDAKRYPPKGRDPYVAFGVNLTQIPYERLEADLNSDDKKVKSEIKALRQMWKVGVLQCIYRAGGGDWGKNKYGDVIKTGLWGSLENMGISVTKEKSEEIVKVFRNSYEEICQCWYGLEGSILDVLKAPGDRIERTIGPNDCILIDKINIQDRNPLLRIKLPSGRRLHYLDAHIKPTLMPWKDKEGKDVYKDSLWYAGQDQQTKQWVEVTSHGGKTFENIVQGIARDVLAEDLYSCMEIGLDVDAHAHDEIIAEADDDDPFSPGLEEVSMIQSRSKSWAVGLPLASEGFSNPYYRKN